MLLRATFLNQPPRRHKWFKTAKNRTTEPPQEDKLWRLEILKN